MADEVNRWDVIADLIEENGWQIGAELGVYQGQTFFHLLDRFSRLHLIGVDHWERTPGPVQDRETGFASYEHKPMEDYARDVKIRAEKYNGRAIIHHGKTWDAAADVDDETLDFVFIDASHDTASVIADIRAWRPKVKTGGALLGHDINWPSVERAVKQELSAWTIADANMWIRFK